MKQPIKTVQIFRKEYPSGIRKLLQILLTRNGGIRNQNIRKEWAARFQQLFVSHYKPATRIWLFFKSKNILELTVF